MTNSVERDGSHLLVDLSALQGLVGSDANKIRRFLSLYLDSLQQQGDELRTHYAEGEVQALGAVAHQLKSSSYSVGARALGNLCAELEKAGKAGEWQILAREMPEFEDTLKMTQAFVVDLLARHS